MGWNYGQQEIMNCLLFMILHCTIVDNLVFLEKSFNLRQKKISEIEYEIKAYLKIKKDKGSWLTYSDVENVQ